MNKPELQQQNIALRSQSIKSGVLIDAMYRRAGELREALVALAEGKITAEEAQAISSNEWINGESRFIVVANIVDAALDHAAGDTTAMERVDAAATALANYTTEQVRSVSSRAQANEGAPKRERTAKVVIPEADAIAAIQQVSVKIGSKSVSIKDFDANHGTLKAADLIAACGKWSQVQRLAGLEVTKRGRPAKAKTDAAVAAAA